MHPKCSGRDKHPLAFGFRLRALNESNLELQSGTSRSFARNPQASILESCIKKTFIATCLLDRLVVRRALIQSWVCPQSGKFRRLKVENSTAPRCIQVLQIVYWLPPMQSPIAAASFWFCATFSSTQTGPYRCCPLPFAHPAAHLHLP